MTNIEDVVVRDRGRSASDYPIRLRARLGFWEMVGHVVLWVVLIIITLGIALFFFPYSQQKLVINRTELLDRSGRAVGRLRCEFSVAGSIGHVLLWILLTVITLGIAFIFYLYRVNRVMLDSTRIEYY